MDEGEKGSTLAGSVRAGTVDTASFALPFVRETTHGHRGGDSRSARSLAVLPAPKGRDS